jgi:hypothetical protein
MAQCIFRFLRAGHIFSRLASKRNLTCWTVFLEKGSKSHWTVAHLERNENHAPPERPRLLASQLHLIFNAARTIRAKIRAMSETTPKLESKSQPWTLEHLPWVWIGALIVLLLFTPLGRLWPLAWMIVGAGVLLGSLTSRDALAFAITAIVAGSLTAGNWADLIPDNSQALEAETPEIQFISLEGVQRIELRSFNGGIKVVNAPGPARLLVRRKGNVTVRSENVNGILNVQAKRPFFAWNTAASFELNLPLPQPLDPKLSLVLSTNNGPVEVTARVERLEVSSSGGRILVGETGATFTQAFNSNASIEISKASGTLEANTSNAAIQVTDGKDMTLKLESSNGGIRLERLQLAANSRSSARTSNAPIDLIAVRASAGLRISGETANAKPNLILPGFEIELDGQRFDAQQNGLGMAELELATSNARITATK